MKKQSDRIKDWREKQKAEGKTSLTIMLSKEARSILLEEKGKTQESYAAIIERALLSMKKQDLRRPNLAYDHNRKDCQAGQRMQNQPPVFSKILLEKEAPPKRLIDDFVNYPSIKDIQQEQAEKNNYGLKDSNVKKGLLRRFFGSS